MSLRHRGRMASSLQSGKTQGRACLVSQLVHQRPVKLQVFLVNLDVEVAVVLNLRGHRAVESDRRKSAKPPSIPPGPDHNVDDVIHDLHLRNELLASHGKKGNPAYP